MEKSLILRLFDVLAGLQYLEKTAPEGLDTLLYLASKELAEIVSEMDDKGYTEKQ